MIKSFFKSLLTLFLISTLLVVGVLFALPYILPQDKLKAEVSEFVKTKTDLDLTIDGEIVVTILPDVSISIKDARIKNPSDNTSKEHKISDLTVRVGMASLIGNNPELNFKTTIDGRNFGASLAVSDIEKIKSGEAANVKITLSLPVVSDDSGNVLIPEPLNPSLKFILSRPAAGEAVIDGIDFSAGNSRAAGKLNLKQKTKETLDIRGELLFTQLDTEEVSRIIGAVAYIVSEVISDGNVSPSITAVDKPYEWSDAQLDFAWLKGLEGDLSIKADSIKTSNLILGKADLSLKSSGGTADIKINNTEIYGGKGKGEIKIDASSDITKIEKQFNFSAIDIGSLLKNSADIDRLEGKGDFNLSISTSGKSERDMVANMNGKGDVSIKDGRLKGIDILAMANYAQAVIEEAINSKDKNTEITNATATFNIENGIVRNDDLLVKIPFSQLNGKGEVNLNSFMVKYRVTPVVGVGSMGLSVPLVIEGDIRKPDVKPDIKSIVTQGVDKLINENKQAREIKEKIEQKLQDVLIPGLLTPPPAAAVPENIQQNQTPNQIPAQ